MLTLRLNGCGVQPSIGLSIEGDSLNFGYCLSGEKIEQVIQVCGQPLSSYFIKEYSLKDVK